MSDSSLNITKDFYNHSYRSLGTKAQRRYPNEELCRFMGRNFLDHELSAEERKKIRILETGCGSGANLWMLAKEGFDAYGIDLSEEGLKYAKEMLDRHHVSAHLSTQDMCALNFGDNYFEAVIDIFSSNCLTKEQGKTYLQSVRRVLKDSGLFFSYFPSKRSEAYQFPGDASLIDSDTLDSISRKDSPFCGQNYPFRFLHSREYEDLLVDAGFEICYSEIVDRTYRNRQETFSFIVIEARKRGFPSL